MEIRASRGLLITGQCPTRRCKGARAEPFGVAQRAALLAATARLRSLSARLETRSGITMPCEAAVVRRMWEMSIHASAEATDFSRSLASLRQRPSRAKLRSTTHLRGRNSQPSAVSERFTTSIVHWPTDASAPRSFGPAHPPSAKTCRSHGHDLRIEASTAGAPSRSRTSAAWTTGPNSKTPSMPICLAARHSFPVAGASC